MATLYSKIHSRAIAKFLDYDLIKFDESSRESILKEYLLSASLDFSPVCKEDLSDRDDELAQFNQDLSDDVIEILATGEAYYWVLPRVNNSENLRNMMSTKDYSFFSPANLLSQLQSLRDSLRKDFRRKIVDYTYRNSNLSDLKA